MDTTTETTTEKKPRKHRTAGPKAPSRKENPAGYQIHYLDGAIRSIQKRDEQTTNFGVDGLGGHFRDALASLTEIRNALAALPADFKAPRKSGGRGRAKKTFVAGQIVKLSENALNLIKEQFPSVDQDCVFCVNPKMVINEQTKLYSIGCTGIDGALPWFYVGFYAAKELTAV